jgi:hypothetical protein
LAGENRPEDDFPPKLASDSEAREDFRETPFGDHSFPTAYKKNAGMRGFRGSTRHSGQSEDRGD